MDVYLSASALFEAGNNKSWTWAKLHITCCFTVRSGFGPRSTKTATLTQIFYFVSSVQSTIYKPDQSAFENTNLKNYSGLKVKKSSSDVLTKVLNLLKNYKDKIEMSEKDSVIYWTLKSGKFWRFLIENSEGIDVNLGWHEVPGGETYWWRSGRKRVIQEQHQYFVIYTRFTQTHV